ncbi:glucosamine-6-phosphate deaminase [Oceanobacillus senegalensis]|uniref:glucosamine-6-phosphate deaminase n=1 Tax=Oceanobacillus senegalensis TaxID=1936063 RepID=UPI000A30726F|nr:glucosamine-6-phosphate deaminase [Oceanobacillus senegalensis]
MNIIKVMDYAEMSDYACDFLMNKMENLQKPVLGLATGSTPEGLYHRLIEKKVSFRNVVTFNLDEYVGLDRKNPNSYYYYMNDKLFNHVDIEMDKVHVPNGSATNLEKECHDYEEAIREAGQIDVQVLGIGVNGHIGFNEPGTAFTSRTHIVELDVSTRQANSRFFDSMEEVPTKAITMGIDSIMDSKEILLLISGHSKAHAVARLLEGEINEDFPASVLRRHKNVTIVVDEAAMSEVKENK